MRPEIIYHAAASLDGFIADADGGVDWLDGYEDPEHFGLDAFYATIDGVIMGAATYVFALGHPWMLEDTPTWVFTSRDLRLAAPTVTLTTESPTALVDRLGAAGHERLWLMGGGRLAASFRDAGLITHYVVSVIPIVLGHGIGLMAPGPPERLQLNETRAYPCGVVSLSYTVART